MNYVTVQVFLEKFMVTQLVQKSLAFKEHEDSLLCSQKPNNGYAGHVSSYTAYKSKHISKADF
jgi:hypothetical protein